MISVLQRVQHASVVVDDHTIASIKQGLLVLVGIEKHDDQTMADKMVHRLLGYRVFPDEADKMNLCLTDINGGLLLVPQFTLAADTNKGMRPSFSSAAPPNIGQDLFEYIVEHAKSKYDHIQSGEFGADMQVNLCNDGPVTLILRL